MAKAPTKPTRAKARPASKVAASRKSITSKAAVRSTSNSSVEYSQLTWALMIIWLALVALFLGLIVYKLYIAK